VLLRSELVLVLQEVLLLLGKHTSEFTGLLGYASDGELIHRGNLALLMAGRSCLFPWFPVHGVLGTSRFSNKLYLQV
jgi:hypothetical protein